MLVKYVAHDGTEFSDESLCRAYEHLIEATKDAKFKKLVHDLFVGITSWPGLSEDDPDPVFNLRHMDKFTANLVKALPALTIELHRAMAETKS